jgi:gas vesicle protein
MVMNDNSAQEVARENGNHMVSFIVGAAIGAGIALLVAPSSGAVTRRRLGENLAKTKNRINGLSSDVRNRLGEFKEDVVKAVETGRQTFSHDREARQMKSDAG